MAPGPPSTCSSCSKPAADKCSSCKLHVYCDKICQKADWKSHKKLCFDLTLERDLRRAAELVQAVFLTFRESTWAQDVEKIEDTANTLNAFHQVRHPTWGWFRRFPDHLVPDEEMKKAVLCDRRCLDAIGLMRQLLCAVLEDLPVVVFEASITLKSIPHGIITHYPGKVPSANWRDCEYNIIQFASTRTKTKWAMDLTGSQFGIHQVLWEWFDYEIRFIDVWKPVSIYEGGALEAHIHRRGKIQGQPSIVIGLEIEVMERINEDVRKWAEGRNLGLPGLIHADDDKFLEGKQELLTLVSCAAREFIGTKDISRRVLDAYLFEERFPGRTAAELEANDMMFCQQHQDIIREYTDATACKYTYL